MSIFDFREWIERSIPIWALAIPIVVLALVAVVQKVWK